MVLRLDDYKLIYSLQIFYNTLLPIVDVIFFDDTQNGENLESRSKKKKK